jgi:hypothetical protein
VPEASHVIIRPFGKARPHHPRSAAGTLQGPQRRALAGGPAEDLILLPHLLQRCQAGGVLGLMDEHLNRRVLRIQPPAGDAAEEIPSPAIVDGRGGGPPYSADQDR